ncbi:hypothetical protein [Methylobacterium sp. J-068]|uniref:hypothetical protein n=1 Tax=Methylobacterium sp. J-068 TaxID=2836649 RepID=UPI001FBBA7D0|nr:hypothetical protein [Methylobacterium sp. J-068]MCJ2035916.1 hypothetical protein [Methylobacterium sp. J-068]
MTSHTMMSETARTRVVLALTLIVFLTTGRAPGMRELRNPDAEAGWGRVAHALKRDLA